MARAGRTRARPTRASRSLNPQLLDLGWISARAAFTPHRGGCQGIRRGGGRKDPRKLVETWISRHVKRPGPECGLLRPGPRGGILAIGWNRYGADKNLALFGQDADVTPAKILCRDEDASPRSGYDGRWWELQANMAMAALVLPKALVLDCLKPCLEQRGSLGGLVLPEAKRAAAIHLVSETFDVNPVVASTVWSVSAPKKAAS